MRSAFPAPLKSAAKLILDFALPPRCAGCATIVEDAGLFCAACWPSLDWLGNGGCDVCGLPLESTEIDRCGRCMANPPGMDRIRAAVAYGELSRSIALRLKYGRKVALAESMAGYMAPLLEDGGERPLVVPVPLHRWRLWSRGFNQSGLLARQLARRWNLPVELDSLRRVKATRPLKGMSPAQRRLAVRGAFKVVNRQVFEGRTIILVDDVFTSGSTAEACTRALRAAGARRVELICWARVVRPSQIMR